MNDKVATALAGAVLAAFALTGCGGGGDDNSGELDAWAKDICASLKTPLDNATRALEDTGVVKDDEKPDELKKRLSQDMGTVAASFEQLADAVDKAGTPPVDDGDKLAKDASGDLRDTAKAYQDLKTKVDELDTKDRADFADGLTGIGEEREALGRRSSDGLTRLQSGELGRAMAEQPGCRPAESASDAADAPSTAG
ncbi:hypothetical protein GCM10027168_02240 [Streptomyces capparidis]